MRKQFNCKRCYQTFKSGSAKPKYCGKCKSSLWNTARTYAVTGGGEPTKTRTKATGKAARNNKPEIVKPKRIAEIDALDERLTKAIHYALDDLKSKSVINISSIQQFAFDFWKMIQRRRDLAFERADLHETDLKERFYAKKGFLSFERDRWRDLPQIVYEKDGIEFRAGMCDERTFAGRERAEGWANFIRDSKAFVENLDADIRSMVLSVK